MNFDKTGSAWDPKLLGAIIASNPYFWVSLIGFLSSIFGTILIHRAEYGFGYGLFGVILASCLFKAWTDYQRTISGDVRSRQNDQRGAD
jgi:hypothetical protein